MTVVAVEDILCGMKERIDALPEGTDKEMKQENVRTLKG
jgi:hypothetical protein